MKSIEDAFDEKKIKKSIRKAKIKSLLKIIIISIIVFIVGTYINLRICMKYSEKAYETNEATVRLSIPNGYISESNDIFGFLGGSGTYKVAKNVGGKNVILEDRLSFFGLVWPKNYSRVNGGGPIYGSGNSGWTVSLWENGYKRMRFFHPELQYNEYQNDLTNIDSIPDEKVIEMAISFDKSYKIYDMFLLDRKLKPAKITWLWLDEFTKEKMDEYEYSIENYDNKANGIYENETIGIEYNNQHGLSENEYKEKYDELVNRLNKSNYINYKDLYEEIMAEGKTSAEDARILGVVVQGTKEDLKELLGNPLIKATSFGVVTDPIY